MTHDVYIPCKCVFCKATYAQRTAHDCAEYASITEAVAVALKAERERIGLALRAAEGKVSDEHAHVLVIVRAALEGVT